MRRKLLLAPALLTALITTSTFATEQRSFASIQQISVTNMLWNAHATGGMPGLTPTTVTVAFNNGGAKPCYTATIPYQGSMNISVGIGQPCSTAVTSITVTPIAGPAGTVFSGPSSLTLNANYFMHQISLQADIDPVFDTTNDTVQREGTVNIVYRGQ